MHLIEEKEAAAFSVFGWQNADRTQIHPKIKHFKVLFYKKQCLSKKEKRKNTKVQVSF
jgi:flavorubredoxin